MTADPAGQLGDHGERRIVSEILASRYQDKVPQFGDDCAVVATRPDGMIIATTDPAPKPVAWQLGYADYYYWGWLLAAINLSDLGAAGGKPLGLLTSLTLPSEMAVPEFNRLLDGVDDCCVAVGTGVVGGNLKEGADGVVRCEATAIGWVDDGAPLSRSGTSPGDVIVALGPTGAFWSAALALMRDFQLDDADFEEVLEVLLRPIPQIKVGGDLRQAGLLRSACDASDGLFGAIRSLTVEQGLGGLLDMRGWQYPDVVSRWARRLDVSPIRLALGFGDLQLVGTVAAEDLAEVERVAQGHSTHLMVLGEATDSGQLTAKLNEGEGLLSNFDNERFTVESQFTAGLESYSTRLLDRPLLDRSSA